MAITKKNSSIYLVLLATITLYYFFAYHLQRTEFTRFLLLYTGLFGSYFYLVKYAKTSFNDLFKFSILFRVVFILAIPNLSQDFYRFIWDGRMIFEGMNPYLYLPQNFIADQIFPVNQATELYAGMGQLNGSHFTNYPPINQLSFLIAALFANKSILGSVVVMRLLIIFADIGIIYFGKKILQHINLSPNAIFWYALNPFIIIELTGNLHFESVMLFFLIWSIYLLIKQKWIGSAILLSVSISVKLIPFLLLPLYFQWFVKKDTSLKLGFYKLIRFYAVVIGFTILLFLPFYSQELISNYSNSVGLWFRNFEFNASFYYIFREVGYLFRGYNEIAIIGKIIPILTILFVGYITFFRKNTSPKELITAFLFGLSFYYFTTTTMHPWYLASLILLSVFSNYKFPIAWSVVIILSYAAYSNDTYKENLWLVSIEYSIVYGFLIWELFFKKKNLI